MSRSGSLWLLHLIVLVFGFTGILGKEISLGAIDIVFFRTLIAFVSLLAIFFFFRKKSRPSARLIVSICLVGVVVAAHWITFFEAIKRANVSVALTTMATTSLFIAFVEPLIKKRRIDWLEVGLGLGVIVGLVFIFSVGSEYYEGILLGLCSALLAAVFGTVNSIFIEKTSALRISMMEMGAGCVAVGVFIFLRGEFNANMFDISAYNWMLLLLLGIVATALAFVGSVEVMKQLSPFTVSLTINLEPIYSIVLALIFYPNDEKMNLGFYIGASIIIGTLFLNSMVRNKRKKRKAHEAPF